MMNEDEKTMIQINKSTAISLKDIKLTERESYDEIIMRLLEGWKKK